jgi:Phosphotransferase enzyme family
LDDTRRPKRGTARRISECPIGERGVVRVGGTVKRPLGSYPPPVLDLLAYLRSSGFRSVPHYRGTDEAGRQIFDWIEGTAGVEPVPPEIAGDDSLIAVAKLIRAYHDVSSRFASSRGGWDPLLQDPSGSTEIVCHNDLSSHNLVYTGHQPIAIVDWEFAAPGSRLWDLAYACVWFVPLHLPDRCRAAGWTDVDHGRRLRLFCDAYGLGDERQRLLDVIFERQRRNEEQIAIWLAQGILPPADRSAALPMSDTEYIRSQRNQLHKALSD